MADFRSVMLMLENWGLSDVLLPFILVFTIFLFLFPLLRQKLKLFQWFQINNDAK